MKRRGDLSSSGGFFGVVVSENPLDCPPSREDHIDGHIDQAKGYCVEECSPLVVVVDDAGGIGEIEDSDDECSEDLLCKGSISQSQSIDDIDKCRETQYRPQVINESQKYDELIPVDEIHQTEGQQEQDLHGVTQEGFPVFEVAVCGADIPSFSLFVSGTKSLGRVGCNALLALLDLSLFLIELIGEVEIFREGVNGKSFDLQKRFFSKHTASSP